MKTHTTNKKKLISNQELISILQNLVGQPIVKIIHPSDGIFIFNFGKKYFDQEEQKEKSEIKLIINKDWQIFKDNLLIINDSPQENENRQSYLHRLETFANNFPIKSFININLEKENILFSNHNFTLKIRISDNEDNGFSLHYVDLNNQNQPSAFHHLSFDKKENSLVKESIFISNISK